MQIYQSALSLSATDLVGYLNCRHLTQLEHAAARGELSRPKFFDPALHFPLQGQRQFCQRRCRGDAVILELGNLHRGDARDEAKVIVISALLVAARAPIADVAV